MEDFKDNKCRICNILFCCKSCREKHEINKHDIFPECDICVHGRTVLKNPSEILLMHLRASHWPLHCVLCEKEFRSTEELLRQCKCPIGHRILEDVEKSPGPLQPYNEHTYESPPLSMLYPNNHPANKNPNVFSSLATSTPMQKGEENNLLEKMHGITPVDYSESNKEGIIKKKRLNTNRSSSPKKVTFSDTSLPESSKKQKSMLKKEECQIEDIDFGTPSNLGTPFYSASDEAPRENERVDENNKQQIAQAQNDAPATVATQNATEVDENNEESNNDSLNTVSAVILPNADTNDIERKDKVDMANTPMKQEDSVTWLSAIDLSASKLADEKIPSSSKVNLYTPVASMVGKFKKRQVNIVLPTPAMTKMKTRITTIPNDLPLPIYSTPMAFESNEMDLTRSNEEVPVISKPNTNIVRKPKENTLSTSELEDSSIANQHERSNEENKAPLATSKSCIEGETSTDSIQGRLWSLMSRVTNAIGQSFSSVDENVIPNIEFSLKRSFTDYDSLDAPPAKRCKLTEVKCRRTIRNLPNIEVTRGNTRIVYTAQSMKVFVDMGTQTDE